MRHTHSNLLAAAISLAVLASSATFASEENEARRLCENKIRHAYGVGDFLHVSEQRLGNHKFLVHGKVRSDGHRYPFSCKVKRGQIKSYSYDGPHQKRDEDEGSGLGTALAVGAGLAIVAALAASQSGDDDEDRTSGLREDKSVLEDECHDELQYRIRDEHDRTARVHLRNSRLEGRDLSGEANVRYHGDHPHLATFTCHFDRHGRVTDSSYYLY